MHGACITCTAMHATVRVRKFVVNKISNGPGDDFLRAPIQIMTPSNRSHPTPTPRRQGSMLPGSQARRASARAVEFRTDRFDRTDYMRLQSAARARSVDGTVARGKMADPKKIVRFRKVSGPARRGTGTASATRRSRPTYRRRKLLNLPHRHDTGSTARIHGCSVAAIGSVTDEQCRTSPVGSVT